MANFILAARTLTTAPLSTTFTPEPSCTENFYTQPTYYSIGGPLASQCFPSGWVSTSQYFSPGICPDGYTQACSSVSSAGTEVETRATCCPSGYACYSPTVFNFVGQACASIFPSKITTTVTDGSNLTVLLATLYPSTEAVNGYGVSIRYNAHDFATGAPTSSSSTPTSSSSTPSQAATSASVATEPTDTGSSSGLSTGAQAGIGIGVAVVALIALFGLGFFMLKKRNARAVPAYSLEDVGGMESQSKTISEAGMGSQSKKTDEVSTLPSELAGSPKLFELDGSNVR